MPWNENYFPHSMVNLPPVVRDKAIEIANALLAEGYTEGRGAGPDFRRGLVDQKLNYGCPVEFILAGTTHIPPPTRQYVFGDYAQCPGFSRWLLDFPTDAKSYDRTVIHRMMKRGSRQHKIR